MNRGIVAYINFMLARSGIVASIIGFTLLLTLAPSVTAQVAEITYTGCGGVDVPIIDDAFESRVVELVNQQRAANGDLPPLKRTVDLSKAARYHAADLGNDNYFNHDTYDRSGGTLVKVCETFDRLRQWYDWSAAGENIAAGYGTPEEVMAGWMNSDGHRRNILNPTFREIGVGYFRGAGDYGVYWVQDLGARSGEYPVIIEREASTTNDRSVDLFIHGDWSEMRLRNDSDGWSEWQPFASRLTWMLNAGAGERIVSVELRNGEQSYSACDTILLTDMAAAAPINAPINPVTEYQLYLPSVVSSGEVQPPVTCD
jgi:uncharacterized protein YkwD